MKKLHIKTIRDAWAIKSRAIAIIAIIACGISVYTGTDMGLEFMGHTAHELYKLLNNADYQITFSPIVQKDLPSEIELKGIPGIKDIEIRLIAKGRAENKMGEQIATVIVLLDSDKRPVVNNLKIDDGNYLSQEDPNGVLVENCFAKAYGFNVGDKIKIYKRDKSIEFHIVGIVTSTEYMMATSNPNFYMPVKGSLGIVYLPLQVLNNIEEIGKIIINNIAITFEKDDFAQNAKALHLLETKLMQLKDVEIVALTPKTEQYSYKAIERRLTTLKVFLPVLIIIFNSITVFVTFIIINKMVHDQRVEIGVLCALGCSFMEVLKSYLIIVLILWVIGSAIGILGSFGVAYIITEAFENGANFPKIHYFFLPYTLIKGVLLGLFSVLASCIIPILNLVKIGPQGLIRGDQIKPIKLDKLKLGRIERAIYDNVSNNLSLKMVVRSIFRNKRLFIFTITCVMFSLAMACSFIITNTSFTSTIKTYFNRQKWDAFVEFNESITTQEYMKFAQKKGARYIEPYVKGFARIKKGEVDIPYQLLGVQLKSMLRPLLLQEGHSFTSYKSNEIILNRETVKKLRAKMGDVIEVKHNNKVHRMKLIGQISNLTLGLAMVPMGAAQEILDQRSKISGAVVATSSGIETDIDKTMYTEGVVSYWVPKKYAEDTIIDGMHEITKVLCVYSILSLVVTSILIVVMTKINIMDRENEYAVLLAMGCDTTLIYKNILLEILFVALVAISLSVPFSMFFLYLIRLQFAKAAFLVDKHLYLKDYVITLVPALCLMFLAVIPGFRFIRNINISKTIKNRIMG